MLKSLICAVLFVTGSAAYSQEHTVRTVEACRSYELGPRSVETCTITNLDTNQTYTERRVCDSNQLGLQIGVGPAKAGAYAGGRYCRTTILVPSMPRRTR